QTESTEQERSRQTTDHEVAVCGLLLGVILERVAESDYVRASSAGRDRPLRALHLLILNVEAGQEVAATARHVEDTDCNICQTITRPADLIDPQTCGYSPFWLAAQEGRWRLFGGRPLVQGVGLSYVMPNTVSVNHRLKLSLSMNCLNSSVSSFSTAVITRARALSCSIRAFCLSEFCLAFWYALSAATRFGMSSVMSLWTRSASVHGMLPNWSLKTLRMFGRRSSSGSGFWPAPVVGTGSISASESGSLILTAAFFSTR